MSNGQAVEETLEITESENREREKKKKTEWNRNRNGSIKIREANWVGQLLMAAVATVLCIENAGIGFSLRPVRESG